MLTRIQLKQAERISRYLETSKIAAKRDIGRPANPIFFMFELEIAIAQEDWNSFHELLGNTDRWMKLDQASRVMAVLLSFKLPIKHRLFGVKVYIFRKCTTLTRSIILT